MPASIRTAQFSRNVCKCFFSSLLGAMLLGASFSGLSGMAATTTSSIIQQTLPNGQTVYIKVDHRQPVVTIDTWVKTGSIYETATNNGVSHFLEHLLFKGTNQYKAGQIDRILESRGAVFNAATSDDFTHYYIKTAPLYFAEAVGLHANMLTHASIPETELPQERKVVQEEINRANDNPERQLYTALTSALFKEHGYGLDTLGPRQNIASMPRQTILDYYHRWYQPENLNTVIVGDVDPEQALSVVKKAFAQAGSAKSSEDPVVKPVNPLSHPESVVLENPGINQSYLAIGLLGPSLKDAESVYAMDIAMMVLGSGKSSRLYQALKEKTSLVTSVSASNATQKHAGMLVLDAQMASENREAVKKILLTELTRLKETGITTQELEKAKNQYLKDFIFENETTDGTASSIGYNVTIGTLENYTQHELMVKQVTLEKVRQALSRYIQPQQAVLVELIPGTLKANVSEEARNNVALLDKAATGLVTDSAGSVLPEKSGLSTVVQRQEPYKVVLPNGITLIGRPLKESATVAFNIFVKGGQSVESMPGTASLLSSVFMQGTRSRTLQTLQEELDEKGMNLSVSASDDYMSIEGNAIEEDFGELLLLTRDVLENPLFANTEIDKKKKQMIQAIDASQDSPSSVVFENLALGLYPHHPYGNVGTRIKEALPGITREDLLKYYETYFSPQNMVVTVVGNFNPEVANSYFTSLFSDCTHCKTSPALDIPKVPSLAKNQEIVVQKKSLSAAWLAQAWLMPPLSDTKDYATFKLIHALIGQGMSSRLFTSLREKQGLAYVVGSLYPTRQEKSYFSAYIGTDPVNLGKVKKGFAAEMSRLKTSVVGASELSEAKSKLIGSFALAHDSNSSQAFYLGLYEVLGKGYRFDQEYPKAVQSITSQDILDASRKWLNQSSVSSVIQPEKLSTSQAKKD
jgi:zinc protease